MARQADFIQENIPEQLELKQRVLAAVSHHAPADVVIASSTSGLMPSDLQRDMVGPERFLVAHPFSPVYLLPLVELVGGRQTSTAALDAASTFFTYLGMHALRVRREVPGHLTDRLQEALWREILHLVNEDVATTGELDDSIVYGPGLRWAAMGTNLIYHLAGGESGMRHMLRQFGPCLQWPWTKLEAPELSEALIDKMVAGTQAQAAGRSIRELERLRDDYLVAIQQVLKPYDIGAGATLRALEERLYEAAAAGARARIDAAEQPLRLVETYVRPEWIDYNGHMTDSRYLQVFGDATDGLFRYAGGDDGYRRSGRAMYTVETHVTHKPGIRRPRARAARARGRRERQAARGAAAGTQGPGDCRRPVRRQHARRGRWRGARCGELDAVREGARLYGLRAALRLRRAAVEHPARLPGSTARALPAAGSARRAYRVPGDERAAGGLGPAPGADHGTGAGRRLHRKRHQALHQSRRPCGLRDPVCRHRRGGFRARQA